MLVKVKRQAGPEEAPYWQLFLYDGTPDITVSAMLDVLNYGDDVFDIDGNAAPRIRWSCSCSQKMCGACAMIINGTPALACAVFLRDLGDTVTLEPLSKFPVVEDLIVDRSIISENLRRAGAYPGQHHPPSEKSLPLLYAATKCLKCGLCLEACPNYVKGENFFGALCANEMFALTAQSEDRRSELKAAYRQHFGKGCSKALGCVKVCPMQIDTIASMAHMNRGK